jgi:hypothetical protein
MMITPNVAQTLETTVIFGALPPTTPAPPAPSMSLPAPLSYQFQVVEYTDDNDAVVKVELQVQQTSHDQYGNIKMTSGFKPVPRIKLPLPK